MRSTNIRLGQDPVWRSCVLQPVRISSPSLELHKSSQFKSWARAPPLEMRTSLKRGTLPTCASGGSRDGHDVEPDEEDSTSADDRLEYEADGGSGSDNDLSNLPPSVMRLICVRDKPRFDMPIVLGSLSSTTRTAFALSHRGQNFILTSAGSVTYSTKINLHPPELGNTSAPPMALKQSKPWKAQVAHIGMECDLVVLRLECGKREEQRFWSKVTPLELGELPQLNDFVSILGPSAGLEESSTRQVQGSVRQVAVMGYASALMSLLSLKIGAQVGKDQIGAPVTDASGNCVGLVTSRQRNSTRGQAGGMEHTAIAAPATLIAQFLDGIISTGSYAGFPSLGIKYKKLEAGALRTYLGLVPGEHGILILDVHPLSSAAKALEPNDVLMSINGKEVGADGLVEFRGSERILCTHFISMQAVGSDLEIHVLRQGKMLQLKTRAEVPPRLLPTHLKNEGPSYLLVSGLIFTKCSVPYLEAAFGRGWLQSAPPLLITKVTEWPRLAGEEVIVVAEMLEMNSAMGYDARLVQHRRLVRFNGMDILNMKKLAAAVLRCTSEHMKFEFEGGSVLVLSTAQANADTKLVMKEYELDHPVSADLEQVMPPRPQPRRKPLAARR